MSFKYLLLSLSVFIISLITWSCEESDTTPPTVSIQSPVSGETVQEIVTINVSTNDNDGIDHVDFFIDDSLHIQDDNSPYTFNWNTTNYSDESSHIITVISYDRSENETVSQPVLVTVNNSGSYPTQIDIISVQYDTIEMIIQWEVSMDGDFSHYELFTSDGEEEEKTLRFMGGDREINSTVISEFNLVNPIWLWISVTDTVGFSTISIGYIVIEDPPTKPEITFIEYIIDSFKIHWTPNDDVDFVSYTLFESDSSDMEVKENIFMSTNKIDSTYVISGIVLNESRYYQIEVVDIFGLTSSSDIRSGSSFQKIVFISNRTGDDEICIMDITGENQQVLTHGMSNVYNPIFSNDGLKILFTSDMRNDREINIIDIDGSNLLNLTDDPNNHYLTPQFTPDDSKIVFRSNRNGSYEIYVMDSDGRNIVRLTQFGTQVIYPRITPDGLNIVYTSGVDIYKVDIGGSNVTNLTNFFNNGSSQSPDISPDGSIVVFQSQIPNFYNEISVIDIDGGNRRTLTNSDTNYWKPLFSPNGTEILFFSELDYEMINIDGTNQRNVTNSETYVYNPQFSPDGEYLIYNTVIGGHSQIILLNLSSGEKINLSNNQFNDSFPRIQPIPNG